MIHKGDKKGVVMVRCLDRSSEQLEEEEHKAQQDEEELRAQLVAHSDGSPLPAELESIFFGESTLLSGDTTQLVRLTAALAALRQQAAADLPAWSALARAPLARRAAWALLWQALAARVRQCPALGPLGPLLPPGPSPSPLPPPPVPPPLSEGPLYPGLAPKRPRFGGGDGE